MLCCTSFYKLTEGKCLWIIESLLNLKNIYILNRLNRVPSWKKFKSLGYSSNFNFFTYFLVGVQIYPMSMAHLKKNKGNSPDHTFFSSCNLFFMNHRSGKNISKALKAGAFIEIWSMLSHAHMESPWYGPNYAFGAYVRNFGALILE